MPPGRDPIAARYGANDATLLYPHAAPARSMDVDKPLPYGNGTTGLQQAVGQLAARLPEPLRPLARLAYNYRWSWTGGDDLFARVAPDRWATGDRNPVRLLVEAAPSDLERAAGDPDLLRQLDTQIDALDADLSRDFASDLDTDRPVAFLCAEFGVHESLPIYSGGLGILAGDILKEASDRALPMVAVGLLYRRGYFHQRVDRSGWQHEYWIDTDTDLLPAALVRDGDGHPITVSVRLWGRETVLQVWRVQVGRVPLFLLDADRPENDAVQRWVTSRLYDGNRDIRLAQYAALGIGSIRALQALGIDPGVVHLNEGHPALAALELASANVRSGHSFDTATRRARQRMVFTTHTPVAAGNEAYDPSRVMDIFRDLPERLRTDRETFLGLGRINPNDHDEPSGMTPLALRLSRHANAVSRRHGEVARSMWQPLFHGSADDVPIEHVTNGVHLPTWMAAPMRSLLDRYLEDGWAERGHDPAVWRGIDDIPDAELWEARNELRRRLVEFVRDRSATDRLARGEELTYVEAAATSLSPDVFTIGFARRMAQYKRLHLLTRDAQRAIKLLEEPLPTQFLFAGKAHPMDDAAKGVLQGTFALKGAPPVASRVAFLEDYDIGIAKMLVSGCDVWVNVPRPPLEASGTSGMKSILNGGLHLSVLDGWWAEAYDGINGWAIPGNVDHDHGAQDARDADRLYDLLEHEVVPLFHDRDEDGIPHRWVARVKASLRTNGPRFVASRMMGDYVSQVYPA